MTILNRISERISRCLRRAQRAYNYNNTILTAPRSPAVRQNISHSLLQGVFKNSRGFTLIELLMVFIVLAALAQVGLVYWLDLRTRSSDVVAISDGRNLAHTVRNNFVNLDNVKYDHNPGDGDEIGALDVSDNIRPPVFTLSNGVRARIVAGSESPGVPEQGYFEAYIYHVAGTADSMSVSGKREFYYIADESSDLYSIATF